ncbi:LysR family transcriptional regulator [Nocardioides convexus]|uniref:helix-turn-helix domain-containing protein n=1 Tax=Nocardioides convexus TaxID=2712224 RepID=UPI0024188542|nr:LysR family transcriptional regulator [Nocardioides convexus]
MEAVSRHRSMGAAARALGTSQPAVTAQVRRIENETRRRPLRPLPLRGRPDGRGRHPGRGLAIDQRQPGGACSPGCGHSPTRRCCASAATTAAWPWACFPRWSRPGPSGR